MHNTAALQRVQGTRPLALNSVHIHRSHSRLRSQQHKQHCDKGSQQTLQNVYTWSDSIATHEPKCNIGLQRTAVNATQISRLCKSGMQTAVRVLGGGTAATLMQPSTTPSTACAHDSQQLRWLARCQAIMPQPRPYATPSNTQQSYVTMQPCNTQKHNVHHGM